MRPMETRESWLRACLTRGTAGWPAGADLPENVRVSVGFPTKTKGRGATRKVEHFAPRETSGGFYEIFVSPTMDSAAEVSRELIREAARIALGRAPTAAELEALNDRARAVVQTLPPYPHTAIKPRRDSGDPGDAAPRPGSRLLRVHCEKCGYSVRMTRKWIRVAVPSCPSGHGVMLVQPVQSATP